MKAPKPPKAPEGRTLETHYFKSFINKFTNMGKTKNFLDGLVMKNPPPPPQEEIPEQWIKEDRLRDLRTALAFLRREISAQERELDQPKKPTHMEWEKKHGLPKMENPPPPPPDEYLCNYAQATLETVRICTLEELPDGSLFQYGTIMALKTDQVTYQGAIEAYILGTGVMFWGGTNTPEKQSKVVVRQIRLRY